MEQLWTQVYYLDGCIWVSCETKNYNKLYLTKCKNYKATYDTYKGSVRGGCALAGAAHGRIAVLLQIIVFSVIVPFSRKTLFRSICGLITCGAYACMVNFSVLTFMTLKFIDSITMS